jgi:hypothetical protein
MVRPIAAGTGATLDGLVHTLFGGNLQDPTAEGPTDGLAEELTGWLVGSPRFRIFVQAHTDKIRKKLRGAADPEARRDVRAELRVARLLLADRRIELGFEAYGSRRAGPDFTVTFREKRSFNVEVTRLRGAPSPAVVGGHVITKLRQLPPSLPNALLVAIETESAETVDVSAAIRTLRMRADKKDEVFFTMRGLEGTRVFYERFLRLGGVFVWCDTASGNERAARWSNPSARLALPERAANVCLTLLRAA